MMCISLWVTGRVVLAVTPVVAGCKTLRVHSMFVLGGICLIPFERCPVGL
jgi:hypothetical protein